MFDKFHVIRHLGEALDKVRKSEYARLSGKDRRFINGQKYTLLCPRHADSARWTRTGLVPRSASDGSVGTLARRVGWPRKERLAELGIAQGIGLDPTQHKIGLAAGPHGR